ncbi:uncharacterized protein VP01_1224g7 [Puccinia sorghi]|uniref:Uncharacterized protein n=1 Tax=Puccinia sorghi TaxID=27349 RepID=A0A0L6VRG4_9BASI|nr:uncharacterized protein VP01_1224g7 [Puccinia sorghi]
MAMREPSADLSTLTNILEDICDKTQLRRKRFSPRVGGPEKGPTGHTLRRCPKKVNIVADEDPHVEDEEGSVYDPEGPIIGNNASGVYAIGVSSGVLIPLGIVNIKLLLGSICMVIWFVVMENMPARYFIVGNDYLVHYRISLLNNERCQFTIGMLRFWLSCWMWKGTAF